MNNKKAFDRGGMMKIQTKVLWGGGILTVVILLVVGGFVPAPGTQATSTPTTYSDLYVDAMHPWIASEGPGTCSICGMNLSQVHGHLPGTPLPSIDNLYVSPANPMWIHEGPGNDPDTGEELTPIRQSPFFQEPDEQQVHDHSEMFSNPSGKQMDHDHAQASNETAQLYTCGMHPDVIQDEPGTCPICGMNLTPLRDSGSFSSGGEREIAYWVAPMDPSYISDSPGKSPMGMDLVPVYKEQLSEGTVQIDPVTLQSIGVRTKPAELRDLSQAIRSNGIVKAAEDSEFKVNARISGWVENLYVSRTGDYVEAGQPLLEIYSPQLVSAEEELVLAVQSQDNRRGKNNSALVDAARQRLRLWNISEAQIEELESTREIKQTMTLTSPASGIVLHKNILKGSSISNGMDLFRIANLNSVWVIAQIYEYELPWISVGDRVEIQSPYDPDLSVQGTVSFIYPTLDTRSRAVEVRIVVQNPNLQLRPDMYVDVRINTSATNGVVAVPKSAVIRSGERDIVFVRRDQGRFEPVEVQLGLEADRYYEIRNGLHAGEEVVVSAQFLLDSEAKLQEAVQRRITQRRQMAASASMNTDHAEK